MFCYDGFLTYVLLVKCALLADLCVDSKERNKLNYYSAWFSFAGSSLAMTAYYTWDEHNLFAFRAIAWMFSFIAGLCWFYSGKMMVMPDVVVNTNSNEQEEKIKLLPRDDDNDNNIKDDIEGSNEKLKSSINNSNTCNESVEECQKWAKFAKQLLNQKSFIAYVSMNWMMNFNVTLSRSFFIFLDTEVMKYRMPYAFYLTVTTLCLYLPKFGIQLMTPFANKYGLYHFIKCVNEGLIIINLVALLIGFEYHLVWGLLVVVQMFLYASWGFYDLIMADVIDEDRVKNKRQESVSTSVHGVQALIVKPSQSLAPMLGVWLLSKYGLHDKKNIDKKNNDYSTTNNELQHAIYFLMFGVPLICTVCQYFIWKQYDLKDDKLAKIKDSLDKRNKKLDDTEMMGIASDGGDNI